MNKQKSQIKPLRSCVCSDKCCSRFHELNCYRFFFVISNEKIMSNTKSLTIKKKHQTDKTATTTEPTANIHHRFAKKKSIRMGFFLSILLFKLINFLSKTRGKKLIPLNSCVKLSKISFLNLKCKIDPISVRHSPSSSMDLHCICVSMRPKPKRTQNGASEMNNKFKRKIITF